MRRDAAAHRWGQEEGGGGRPHTATINVETKTDSYDRRKRTPPSAHSTMERQRRMEGVEDGQGRRAHAPTIPTIQSESVRCVGSVAALLYPACVRDVFHITPFRIIRMEFDMEVCEDFSFRSIYWPY